MKPPKPATPEAEVLLRAAGRDYKTFSILRNNLEAPLASTCFHAQQYVEAGTTVEAVRLWTDDLVEFKE